MTDEKCGNCRFFLLLSDASDEIQRGACRRNPPALMYMPIPVPKPSLIGGKQEVGTNWSQQGSTFPPIRETSWCGEWRQSTAIPSVLAAH